jgi:hypothetical protein
MFSKINLLAILSIIDNQPNNTQHNRLSDTQHMVKLSVTFSISKWIAVMLNVFMLSVVAPLVLPFSECWNITGHQSE